MADFRILAETISERQYLDIKELEDQISFFFKLWASELSDSSFFNDDVSQKRIAIQVEQSELLIKRNNLEHQVLMAKNKIKRNEFVDLDWIAKLNYAFRVTKQQLQDNQDRLGNLKALELTRKIEKLKNNCDSFSAELLKLMTDKFGERITIQLSENALRNI